MQQDPPARRELLARALEHASVIGSFLERLDDGDLLTTAGRAEVEDLQALLASGDVSLGACAEAVGDLARVASLAHDLAELSAAHSAARSRT